MFRRRALPDARGALQRRKQAARGHQHDKLLLPLQKRGKTTSVPHAGVLLNADGALIGKGYWLMKDASFKPHTINRSHPDIIE